MNSDIRNNMKNILKKKIEKKCNKNGFIDEVYKIIEYSDGIMVAENLNGAAIYNISYHCRICIPIENTFIIGNIKMVNPDLIVAVNGPLFIFIPKSYVDTNIWDIPDNFMHKKVNKKLAIGNFVKVQIVDKRINQGDSQIKIMGKLFDFASEEEVEKFYGAKILKEEVKSDNESKTDESNFII